MMLPTIQDAIRCLATVLIVVTSVIPASLISADSLEQDRDSNTTAEASNEKIPLRPVPDDELTEQRLSQAEIHVEDGGDIRVGSTTYEVVQENGDSTATANPTGERDRFWLINTRHLSSSARCVNLDSPNLAIYRLHCSSRPCRVPFEEYLQTLGERRMAVVYVHGNRIPPDEAIERGFAVYRNVKCYRTGSPIDWVIWSWPSEKKGLLMRDARIKASRTDGQGLYLAWVLKHHAGEGISTTLIGYSFGGRSVTGALHAAAGGALAGRKLPGEPVKDGAFDAGLVAPAVDAHWLTSRGYHHLATQNLNQLVLMYNRRDAVLKRFWLVDKVKGRMALGYSGPTAFAPRFDGTKLPVRARDCSPSIGVQHDELDYYRKSCHAGWEMARLIDDYYVNH